MRKYPLASLVFVGLGGCGGLGLEPYLADPTNLTVLGIFVGLLAVFFLTTFAFGRPEAKLKKAETTRQERAWFIELDALRNDFVVAQQAVLDQALELLTDKQKDHPELKKRRLKAHSAMAKVIELQEEMLRAGVPEDRVAAMEEF